MTVLLYSYYPLFDSHLAGGLQMTVRVLLRHFVSLGIYVRVICPEGADRELVTDPSVTVWPVLKEIDPLTPYPMDMAHNVRALERSLAGVDVVWTVDRALPLRIRQPVVLTLSALCYPSELEALFSETWDSIIVTSQYAARVVAALLEGIGARAEGPPVARCTMPRRHCAR